MPPIFYDLNWQGGKHQPAKPGLYLRMAKSIRDKATFPHQVYSVWDGESWGASGLTEDEAWAMYKNGHASWVQDWPWTMVPEQ